MKTSAKRSGFVLWSTGSDFVAASELSNNFISYRKEAWRNFIFGNISPSMAYFNPLKACSANQLTGFYVMVTMIFKWSRAGIVMILECWTRSNNILWTLFPQKEVSIKVKKIVYSKAAELYTMMHLILETHISEEKKCGGKVNYRIERCNRFSKANFTIKPIFHIKVYSVCVFRINSDG